MCSVGNIPLAAVLWAGGISFSGVIAFVFADLIVIPIVLIYRKYYGGKVAALLVAMMFATIVAAALIVDGIFSALGLVPTHRPSIESISEREITWNYTTVLNIVFLLVAAALVGLTLRRGAKDPVCGMTVDRHKTPHRSVHDGATFYFCSAHCKKRFDADPERSVEAREARRSRMRAGTPTTTRILRRVAEPVVLRRRADRDRGGARHRAAARSRHRVCAPRLESGGGRLCPGRRGRAVRDPRPQRGRRSGARSAERGTGVVPKN